MNKYAYAHPLTTKQDATIILFHFFLVLSRLVVCYVMTTVSMNRMFKKKPIPIFFFVLHKKLHEKKSLKILILSWHHATFFDNNKQMLNPNECYGLLREKNLIYKIEVSLTEVQQKVTKKKKTHNR